MIYKYEIIIILSDSLSSLPLVRKNALSFVPIVTHVGFAHRAVTRLQL